MLENFTELLEISKLLKEAQRAILLRREASNKTVEKSVQKATARLG